MNAADSSSHFAPKPPAGGGPPTHLARGICAGTGRFRAYGIVLGADGKMATPFNTQGMYRGWIGGDGVPHVAIFANETLPVPGQ